MKRYKGIKLLFASFMCFGSLNAQSTIFAPKKKELKKNINLRSSVEVNESLRWFDDSVKDLEQKERMLKTAVNTGKLTTKKEQEAQSIQQTINNEKDRLLQQKQKLKQAVSDLQEKDEQRREQEKEDNSWIGWFKRSIGWVASSVACFALSMVCPPAATFLGGKILVAGLFKALGMGLAFYTSFSALGGLASTQLGTFKVNGTLACIGAVLTFISSLAGGIGLAASLIAGLLGLLGGAIGSIAGYFVYGWVYALTGSKTLASLSAFLVFFVIAYVWKKTVVDKYVERQKKKKQKAIKIGYLDKIKRFIGYDTK